VGLWLNLATDRPKEGCYLSGDRGCRDHGLLAIGDEPAIAGTQPHLRLPGDGSDRLRQTLEPILQYLSDPGRMAVRSRSLDEDAPRSRIACLRNGPTSHRVTGCAFRRNKTEERHQLTRRTEPTDVADLGREGDSDKERNASEGLIGRHDRCHGPCRNDAMQLLFQGRQPSVCGIYRLNLILKNNLLRWMIELLRD
jgi:hypothetical protein